MDSILKYPIIPRRVYEEYKLERKIQISDTKSFKKLFESLIKDAKLNDKSDKSILAKLIFFDFKNYLSHPVIQKDNNSAKALEQRIALIGEGTTSDKFLKKDPDFKVLLNEQDIEKLRLDILQKIASNFREKGDVIFYNSSRNTSYKISIKSLIVENKEINFGAFEWTTLIDGILEEQYKSIGERKNYINLNINNNIEIAGRGSRSKLISLFKHIQYYNKWNEFIDRFSVLFKGVFKEDILIYMKEYKTFKLYIIDNDTFCNTIINSIKNAINEPKKMILNRWEGNSIRVDRDLLLNHANIIFQENYVDLFDEDLIKNKIQSIENIKYKELIAVFKK